MEKEKLLNQIGFVIKEIQNKPNPKFNDRHKWIGYLSNIAKEIKENYIEKGAK